jgi:curved DNA-binding protein
VHLKVPAGTNSGQKLRISKRGMPKNNLAGKPENGDLFAVTQIVSPTTLSEKERELLQALAISSTFNPRTHFN